MTEGGLKKSHIALAADQQTGRRYSSPTQMVFPELQSDVTSQV